MGSNFSQFRAIRKEIRSFMSSAELEISSPKDDEDEEDTFWLAVLGSSIKLLEALTLPRQMIDPAIENEVKLTYLQKKLDLVDSQLEALGRFLLLVVGDYTEESLRQAGHPLLRALYATKQSLTTELEKLRESFTLAYRPKYTKVFWRPKCTCLSFVDLVRTTGGRLEQLHIASDFMRIGKLHRRAVRHEHPAAEQRSGPSPHSFPTCFDREVCCRLQVAAYSRVLRVSGPDHALHHRTELVPHGRKSFRAAHRVPSASEEATPRIACHCEFVKYTCYNTSKTLF